MSYAYLTAPNIDGFLGVLQTDYMHSIDYLYWETILHFVPIQIYFSSFYEPIIYCLFTSIEPSISVNYCDWVLSQEWDYFFYSEHVLDISDGFHDVGGFQTPVVCSLIVAWIIVYLVLIKGVDSFGKVRRVLLCESEFKFLLTLENSFVNRYYNLFHELCVKMLKMWLGSYNIDLTFK